MENRHNRFRHRYFATIDRLLIKLSAAAVILLLVCQVLLINSVARKYMSLADRLEGEQITSPATMYAADVPLPNPAETMSTVNRVFARSMRTLRPGKDVTIRMINPPADTDAVMTVNGKNVGNFARGKVDITLYDGDYIEIDATKIKTPAQFIIDTHKNEMVFPIDGILLEGQNNLIVVGKVIFKR
jgi:hypothetical protein